MGPKIQMVRKNIDMLDNQLISQFKQYDLFSLDKVFGGLT
jgi:hypothetical protein